MKAASRTDYRLPYAYVSQIGEVDDEIRRRVEKHALALRQQFVSSQNTYRMKHGRQWQTMHADNPDNVNETQLHSTEIEVSKQRVVDHDLGHLLHFLSDLPEKMHAVFMKTMLHTLSDPTDRSGNVVSGKEFKDAFEEMLSKIAFGVDRYGIPSRPTALVPPSVMAEVRRLAAAPDPVRSARVAAITERKTKEAIADEARRISRYRFE